MKNEYKVLIVEDLKSWIREMKNELSKAVPNAQIEVAYCQEEARQKLANSHYHFTSLDQNMPTHPESFVSVNVGAGFTVDLQDKYPCLGLGIYTAYSEDENYALSVGRAAGRTIPVWRKSAGSGDPSGISVPKWAGNVKEWMATKYLPFCFNQAATHLPCHLAETAGHINGVVGKDNKNDAQIFARQSFHFWTLVLQLSSAQAMAIARSAGISFMVPSDHKYEALENMLTDLLPVLQSKSSVSLWTPYIGDDGKQLINGSQAIRLLRNQHSHETPLEDYRVQNKEILPNLQKIMDAAIFWANHPLLTDIRPCGGNRYKAKVIKGTGYPWTEQEFQMDAADLNPDHVYLKYSSPYSDTVKLIDLWPFVSLEFNKDLNRPCLFLISHRWKNNWYRVSMNNGHPEIWKPSPDALQVLE